MADIMMFPDTVEEYMEQYKVVDVEHIYSNGVEFVPIYRMKQWFNHKPQIDLVRCGECKHRPIKDDSDGADYGFNIIEPTDGDDICPCLVEDGWYSWMPKDNFFCGRGERGNNGDKML